MWWVWICLVPTSVARRRPPPLDLLNVAELARETVRDRLIKRGTDEREAEVAGVTDAAKSWMQDDGVSETGLAEQHRVLLHGDSVFVV